MIMKWLYLFFSLFVGSLLYAQAQFTDTSVADIFRVDSITRLNDHPAGVAMPHLSKGVVIVGGPTNWTQKQLDGKLLINYFDKNRRFVGIFNQDKNRFRKIENAGTNETIGYGVEKIHGDFGYFYTDNQLLVYQFSTDSLSLATKVVEPISSNIITDEQNVYFATGPRLFCLDRQNEEMSLMYEGTGLISRLLGDGNGLVFWEDRSGLKKINKENNSIIWSFTPEFSSLHSPYLNIADERIVFSAGDLFCLSSTMGDLIWRTNGNCSKYHYFSRVVGEYALHYNSCFEEGDSPAVLELLDLQTGKVIANAWVSDIYPELENFPVSEMDMSGFISFGKATDAGVLVGLRSKEILWFSLK